MARWGLAAAADTGAKHFRDGTHRTVDPERTIARLTPLLPDHRAAVRDAALVPMRMMGIATPLIATGMILTQALFGAGNTRFVMIVELCLHFTCLVPLAWILGVRLDFGIMGMFAAAVAYIVLLSAIMIWKFRTGDWKHIRLEAPSKEAAIEWAMRFGDVVSVGLAAAMNASSTISRSSSMITRSFVGPRAPPRVGATIRYRPPFWSLISSWPIAYEIARLGSSSPGNCAWRMSATAS